MRKKYNAYNYNKKISLVASMVGILMASQGYANTILTCPEGNDVHVAADGSVTATSSGYKFSSDNVPNSGGGVSGPVTFLYAEIVPEIKQLECLYQFSGHQHRFIGTEKEKISSIVPAKASSPWSASGEYYICNASAATCKVTVDS